MQIKHTFPIALAFGLAGCIPFAQADDPAILVCEEIIKLELLAPRTYERVTARIEDQAAHISYDAMNAAGVPIRNARSCVFEQREDQRFYLSTRWVTDGADERLEELRLMKVKAYSLPTYEERFSTLNAIDAEAAKVADTTRKNLGLHMSYELGLIGIDVYPIAPEQTQLSIKVDQ